MLRNGVENMKSFPCFIKLALPRLCLLIYVLAVSVGTFAGGLWAGLGIGGAVLVFAGTGMIQRKTPPVDLRLMGFAGLILGTIALLNLHTDYPAVAWHLTLQLSTILLPLALWFSPQVQAHINHERFFPIVTTAAFIGAAALGLEFLLGTPLLHAVKGIQASATEYNRGISYLVIFSFPLMAYLLSTRHKWAIALFILILLIPTSLTESRATRMAFIFGLATTAAAFVAPLLTRRLLVVLLVALLAFPFGITELFLHNQTWVNHLPPSWHHRVEIWDYMSYRIFEHPVLGWGIGSSQFLPYMQPHGDMYQYVLSNAPHPHNVIIQLWVELGLPGLALGFVFALVLLHKAGQLPAKIAPFALGAWVACLCISLVAYNFWSDSLFALFALAPLAFIMLERTTHNED